MCTNNSPTIARVYLVVTATLFHLAMSAVYSAQAPEAILRKDTHRLGETEVGTARRDFEQDPVPIMWEDPGEIETRDLFYGPGSSQGAPNAADKFTFVKRKGSPVDTSEKIVVRDDRGRTWTVKFGPEARAEVAATRILWAVGYHTDQDYFVDRANVQGRGGFEILNVRFERDDDGFKETGRWAWNGNRFAGTRDLQGLKVLMAVINNWDLSTINNRIAESKTTRKVFYYVSDTGASFGRTGAWINKLPMYRDVAVPGSRGDARAFAAHKFIENVSNGEVVFHWERRFGRDVLSGISVESARWIGDLLGRLSDKQLTDAFRAGGFNDYEVTTFVGALRGRIRQLQGLGQTAP